MPLLCRRVKKCADRTTNVLRGSGLSVGSQLDLETAASREKGCRVALDPIRSAHQECLLQPLSKSIDVLTAARGLDGIIRLGCLVALPCS